jgi:hypothetical protein
MEGNGARHDSAQEEVEIATLVCLQDVLFK